MFSWKTSFYGIYVSYCLCLLQSTISHFLPSVVCSLSTFFRVYCLSFLCLRYNPEATSESIDEEGFFHTGDSAEFDGHNDGSIPSPSGFMKITGRLKDLIVTTGGENIPAGLLSQQMKDAMPALSNCIVIGDKRKYLTMLVSLKVKMDSSQQPTDELTGEALSVGKKIGSSAKTYSDAQNDSKWKSYIDDGMKKANEKASSNAQKIQKWAFLPKDLNEKDGDLTPTLKIKRNVVVEKYQEMIDKMYSTDSGKGEGGKVEGEEGGGGEKSKGKSKKVESEGNKEEKVEGKKVEA
jgi:acyl-CoA synthetase (AMP-forming)/AMP-acid ligase II